MFWRCRLHDCATHNLWFHGPLYYLGGFGNFLRFCLLSLLYSVSHKKVGMGKCLWYRKNDKLDQTMVVSCLTFCTQKQIWCCNMEIFYMYTLELHTRCKTFCDYFVLASILTNPPWDRVKIIFIFRHISKVTKPKKERITTGASTLLISCTLTLTPSDAERNMVQFAYMALLVLFCVLSNFADFLFSHWYWLSSMGRGVKLFFIFLSHLPKFIIPKEFSFCCCNRMRKHGVCVLYQK